MKKIFIKTRNVRNFIGLVEALKSKPKNIPKMGLIYGEPANVFPKYDLYNF